jgi:hypothetical protein
VSWPIETGEQLGSEEKASTSLEFILNIVPHQYILLRVHAYYVITYTFFNHSDFQVIGKERYLLGNNDAHHHRGPAAIKPGEDRNREGMCKQSSKQTHDFSQTQ